MAIGMNTDQLVMLSVVGNVSSPRVPAGAVYRVGHDGQPHIVPATGGIAYNVRVGDRAVGWAGDHVEPAVSLRNPDDGANGGLNTFACVGNTATVVSGAAKGATGTVTGKHGGIEHVMVDFAADVLGQLVPGDQILVRAFGQGLRLDDFPAVSVSNLDPALAAVWLTGLRDGQLVVPVAKTVPAAIMGSGLGSDNVSRGDYDITLFDPETVETYGLADLRLGDLVAILDAGAAYGRYYRKGAVSVGVVAHADSYKAGHGPGVTGLLSALAGEILPVVDAGANIAALLGIGTARPEGA
ncbi:MAG: hypothetical protein AVDCRST_MAG33-787 [uncultured Thermomicrobiales bacterium]|uniref:DUF4438 domain-containing protein n=1 Tax=uncultured Thermomicrobiales bacterium TaxID=1645740 RepID=A0A6J4UG07_9BACT|nr:MAG: hypothetical protein AVDCRST_MAG33-787 [uncultured Thermomicrobiales bacterium]